MKPYLQPELEQDNEESAEEPEASRQELANNASRRNAERTRRLPARFQQNIADVSIFIQGSSDDGPKSSDTIAFERTSLFMESRRKEINGLLKKGVFEIIDTADVLKGVRIFNS